MPLIDDPRYRELKENAEFYQRVTGDQAYLYPSAPGGGEPVRFVFRKAVCLGLGPASAYAQGLARLAQEHLNKEAAARRAAEIEEEMKEYDQ